MPCGRWSSDWRQPEAWRALYHIARGRRSLIARDYVLDTADSAGPVLLQDHHLIEKLAHFNRERIPERIVHAVGIGACSEFEVQSDEVPRWTKLKLFAERGKKTPVFVRFSTVAGSKGAADTARDPRGFAVKFYTDFSH